MLLSLGTIRLTIRSPPNDWKYQNASYRNTDTHTSTSNFNDFNYFAKQPAHRFLHKSPKHELHTVHTHIQRLTAISALRNRFCSTDLLLLAVQSTYTQRKRIQIEFQLRLSFVMQIKNDAKNDNSPKVIAVSWFPGPLRLGVHVSVYIPREKKIVAKYGSQHELFISYSYIRRSHNATEQFFFRWVPSLSSSLFVVVAAANLCSLDRKNNSLTQTDTHTQTHANTHSKWYRCQLNSSHFHAIHSFVFLYYFFCVHFSWVQWPDSGG